MNHQLGQNRNARHQLERDLQNKDSAIAIGKQRGLRAGAPQSKLDPKGSICGSRQPIRIRGSRNGSICLGVLITHLSISKIKGCKDTPNPDL